MTALRMWFNGRPATLDDVGALLSTPYGHFTSMQARGGRVQGLQRHLARLQQATRALFASDLDLDAARGWLRDALGDADASVRMSVYSRAFDRERPLQPAAADLLLVLGPPRRVDAAPVRVCSVQGERAAPQLKHLGSFGLWYQRRLAQQRGYDDALLVTADGEVAEGTIWNVGFVDADGIVWPTAPALDGISMQLLKAGLAELGVAQTVRRVDLAEVERFRGAFFTNSTCAALPLAAIDAVTYTPGPATPTLLARALATQPWEAP
ncbi:MAG: aminodeoxychorismate lyase [Xanthomonadales bacterium]|nr:aminodeoxychorismate lyase [Xanthomonadales bacterium]MDL1868321.1 aminodeoxychorismate lyase [Gammaproteobacteria bacterium PRO6]